MKCPRKYGLFVFRSSEHIIKDRYLLMSCEHKKRFINQKCILWEPNQKRLREYAVSVSLVKPWDKAAPESGLFALRVTCLQTRSQDDGSTAGHGGGGGHRPGRLAQASPGGGTVGEGQTACKAHSLFLRPHSLWTNRIRWQKCVATGSPYTTSHNSFTPGAGQVHRSRASARGLQLWPWAPVSCHSEPTQQRQVRTAAVSSCDSQERSTF